IAERELGKRIASGFGRTLGRVGLERRLTSGKLVTHLVEVLAVVFEAEAQAVFAVSPGYIVDQLECVVVDEIGTVLRVADGGEAIPRKGRQRNAPRDRGAGLEVRHPQSGNRIDVV